MPKLLSYMHAVNTIRLHYQQAGFIVGEKTPGWAVSNEFKISVENERLGALYAFIDEFIFLIRYISYYFTSAMAKEEKRATTFHRLAIKMLTTLSSIRALCGFGLDSNARMQLRLLYETAILWCRFIFDEEARVAFEGAYTPKAANEYWHQYLARGKSEKIIRKAVGEASLNWLGNYEDKRLLDKAQMLMGLSSHATPTSIIFDAMKDIDEPSDTWAVRSTRDASHFTLSTAIFVATLPFSFTPEIEYGLRAVNMMERADIGPHNDRATNWDAYSRIVWLMPLSLFLASINFTNGLISAGDIAAADAALLNSEGSD